MGDMRDNIRRNLGYYLSLRSVSQKELADRLGVTLGTVSSWIKGTSAPDIEAVAQICNFLDITVIDLFGTQDDTALSSQERVSQPFTCNFIEPVEV